MLPMTVATTAIVNSVSPFLVARKAANLKLPGFWEYPGEKVEPSETLQALSTIHECV
jgi:hypothetical protein